MRKGLIRLADLLFGASTPPDRSGRAWLARYCALAGVLALVVFARRPDSILRPQFWAEDGSVFFYQQLMVGFWSALGTPYAGFPFLGPRLVAALASLLPTVAIPLAYNASAILITGLTMATFSLPAYRHLVRSDGVRAAACVATVCIPAGQELLATPTTLGYFFAIWLIFLCVMRAPRTSGGATMWCLGGALAALSAPLAPLAAPIWLLRAARGVSRRDGRDIGFGATQAAALLVVIGMAAMLGTPGELPGGLEQSAWRPAYLSGALWALGWVMASCVDSALLPVSAFHRLEALGTLPVVAPAVLVAVGVVIAFRDLSQRARVTVCLAIYLFVASLYLVLIGRPIIVLLLKGEVPNLSLGVLEALGSRHRFVPYVALVLVAAGIIDGAQRARIRVGATVVACAALLFAWTPGFRVPPFPDLDWPLWAARLDRKIASGSREPLVIPSHPFSFEIVIDSEVPKARFDP